jgi:peptidoglycan hydrolase CwlO-like protein
MKKLISLALCTLILSACSLKKDAEEFIEDGKDSYDNLVEEVEDVKDKVNTTVDKVKETKEDIDTAIDKVNEAKAAIDEITQ